MKIWILVLCGLLAALLVLALLLPLVTTETPAGESNPTEVSQPVTEVPTQPSVPVKPTAQPNSFRPADFAYDGDYLSCLTVPYKLGIDVSKYQQNVDWQKVADAGITFVVIRIGGRGYGQSGALYADELAQSHYDGAKAAGLQVGAYFFSQAVSVAEAREEAAYALELTKEWGLDMPIVFDWEYVSDTARTAHSDAETVTACAAAFCDRILESGKQAMIYVRPELEKLQLDELTQYQQWVAWYSDTMDYPYHFDMWQYTKTGSVPGISGNVDINLFLP
ncbi:MAG: lysozyme [Ruminococcaceae bacterium]|nr:lysozyme [Oscillospiraceae bacterium]